MPALGTSLVLWFVTVAGAGLLRVAPTPRGTRETDGDPLRRSARRARPPCPRHPREDDLPRAARERVRGARRDDARRRAARHRGHRGARPPRRRSALRLKRALARAGWGGCATS